MFNKQLIQQFLQIKTPCYYYDTGLLLKTLFAIKSAASLYNFQLHYAIKANANSKILKSISEEGFGADCVSGNEIILALNTGFHPNRIVFAGVGKTDDEILLAIEKNIFCINAESLQELEVINHLASGLNKKVRIALRINPDIDAHTHQHITTGLHDNKFGLSWCDVEYFMQHKEDYQNLIVDGVHFHIGSQITRMQVFSDLCYVVNQVLDDLAKNKMYIQHINMGGGLGINYAEPESQIPDFQTYFDIFHQKMKIKTGQIVHFEPGRAIVGQSGALITRVLYVKENGDRKTIIVDAGFTELLRPALYQAKHKIVNLTNENNYMLYDIAGPVCETSDYFGKSILLPETTRGDLLAIYSTGAYGEVMASQYNLRQPAEKYFSEDFHEKHAEILNNS
ncbi:MAG: diaminopimelate decarboxylase [Bacteroidales bacterium]